MPSGTERRTSLCAPRAKSSVSVVMRSSRSTASTMNRARSAASAGGTSPSRRVSAQPRMRVMGPRKSWTSMPAMVPSAARRSEAISSF